jgi:hypothetical protein
MLKNTFIHIFGVGVKTEQAPWKQGILSWDDLLTTDNSQPLGRKTNRFKDAIKECQEQLQSGDGKE